jgi:sugar lactone lactonase YvrE
LADCYGNGCDVDPAQDPLNCGACGVSCAEGGCNAGVCSPSPEILATRDGELRGIAVDDMAVYWSESGAIIRQLKSGGAPIVLAKTKALAWHLALDEGYIYWAESDSGTVARAPKAGGPTEIIASGEAQPFAIAVDAATVYWTNLLGNEIRRSPKNESLPQTLIGETWDPTGLAVDAESVYSTNGLEGGEIGRIPKTGGAAVALSSNEGIPGSIAIDGADAYVWVNVDSTSGQIRRVAKAGGPTSVVTPLEPKWNSKITLDAMNVYWCSSGIGNMVKKVTKTVKGGPVSLASGDYECGSVAVDDTHVYWTNIGYHRVLRTPK